MIAILDYKMGNVQSIANMYKKIGVEAKVTDDLAEIQNADKLILPGVGYFDYAMNNLRSMPYFALLNHLVLEEKINILGICLGAQLMLDRSAEGEDVGGLAWIKGDVVRFNVDTQGLRVPHMGWNDVYAQKSSNLTDELPEQPRYYFVHTYHFDLKNQEDNLLNCSYGKNFSAAFARGNIYGVQFHPEKSHKYGMKLLKNFAEI
jgi:imidazole glycerol-phosphate synthase subunit HisH